MIIFLPGKIRTKYVFLTMGAVIIELLAFLGAFQLLPLLLKMELGAGENAALRILKAYQIWNNLLIWGLGAFTVVMVPFVLWQFIQNTREHKVSPLSVVFFGLMIFLCSLGIIMPVSENLVSVNRDYQQDIMQIEEGTLSTDIVYLGGTTDETLPGTYNTFMEQPAQKFLFISVEHSSGWGGYFIPVEIPFEYSKDDIYNNGLSIEKNAILATRFQIKYTDCIGMITSIERLPKAEQ